MRLKIAENNYKYYILIIYILLIPVMRVNAESTSLRYRVFNAADGMDEISVQTITCTYSGRMIFTTLGMVSFYDGKTFLKVKGSTDNLYFLPKYTGNYHLYFDKHHHLWLKNTHTLGCVDMMLEKSVTNIEQLFREMGINYRVEDLFSDSNNDLWLLSGNMLYGYDDKVKIPINPKRNLQDVAQLGEQVFLLYNDGRVWCYDVGMQRYLYSRSAYEDESLYASSSVILPYRMGFFQIRNGKGGAVLKYFNVRTRCWNDLLETTYHLNNMVIHGGKLYVPCEFGYWEIDLKTWRKRHIDKFVMLENGSMVTDINVIAFDRQGGMWMGTEKRGALYARPYAYPFTSYDWESKKALQYGAMMYNLPPDGHEHYGPSARCVLHDSRGWTWIGTTQGVKLYRKDKGKALSFGGNDGLFNNVINAFVEDNQHRIWASTNYGITCFVIEHDSVVFVNSYASFDNIPTEPFVQGRAMKLSNGNIVMQQLDHVIEFNPATLKTLQVHQNFRLYPKLSMIYVNGERIEPGEKYNNRIIIDRATSRVNDIYIDHGQRNVVLFFSCLNYFRPVQSFYRLRIKGMIEKWHILSHGNTEDMVSADGTLRLPLEYLAPGNYQLEIQASMYPTIWNTKPKIINIHVMQPWWRTTGLYLALFVVLVVLIGIDIFLYTQLSLLSLRRNMKEDSLMSQLYDYIDKCESFSETLMAPRQIELDNKGKYLHKNDLLDEDVARLMKIRSYLLEDRTLKMEILCKMTGIELEEFFEMSERIFKCSPRMLTRAIRLEQSRRLLRMGTHTIEEVSHICGFVTPNYFIASFVKLYGYTPVYFISNAL